MLLHVLLRSIRLLPAVALVIVSTTIGNAQVIDQPAAAASEDPYYGPGWAGPVNNGPGPACPAWYGAHTECVSAASSN